MTKPFITGWRPLRVALLAVGAMLVAVGTAQAGKPGDFVLPGSRATGAGRCVEDTEFMRRNHFEVIRHQRDETVYGGIRSTKHSLAGCVSCHAVHTEAGEPVPINGKGQFCAACHAFAAVKINCFDCHATVPEGEAWNQITDIGGRPTDAGAGQSPSARLAASGPVPGGIPGASQGLAGQPPTADLPAPFAPAPAAAGTASAPGITQ